MPQAWCQHKQRDGLAGRKIKRIDSKLSDTDKGTESEPDMRSRLCAREIKRLQVLGVSEIAGNASDLFASKPPVEAIRMIFSLLMSRRVSGTGKSLKVRLFDIKRAYFNASADQSTCTSKSLQPPIQAVCMIFSLLMSRRLSSTGKKLKVRLFDIKRAYFKHVGSTRASAHRSPCRLLPGGHGPLDSDRDFAQVNVRDSPCRNQLEDGIRFVLDRGRLGERRGLPKHLRKRGH